MPAIKSCSNINKYFEKLATNEIQRVNITPSSANIPHISEHQINFNLQNYEYTLQDKKRVITSHLINKERMDKFKKDNTIYDDYRNPTIRQKEDYEISKFESNFFINQSSKINNTV